MKKLYVCKADPITDNEPVPDAQINITEKLPEYESLEKAEAFYKLEAELIADILTNHLSQGVRHQLLLALLKKDALNLYRGR